MSIDTIAIVSCAILVLLMLTSSGSASPIDDEPLMDWSPWEQYRDTVAHPAGYINSGDLANALANIERYEWARSFAEGRVAGVDPHLGRITPEFCEMMLEQQSVQKCYQCPACRDKGLAQHPGGNWGWSLDDPEVITCRGCKTVFPNDEYPETIVLECTSEAGKGQKFSYYGGETFKQWGYAHCRPSFTGMVRGQKVGWCITMTSRFALAYALSQKPEYAEATRLLLLRFAEVYPRWLLVSSYGEIADLDPHIAGLTLRELPVDELVYPPNEPNRVVYADYWATGRVGGGGMEGLGFTMPMLQAYEFTRDAKRADGTPVYTEDELKRIERDVLLESCVHLIGEKRINNKSVGNRIAVAMVGISLGHPGFVRFGLEGWELTMDGWFLADGCTPESPAYAIMSLNGIYKMAQAIRGYSDPPGYTDEDGRRIEDLNLYEGLYALVWQRMYEGLQGNLLYPPYADSYRTSGLGKRFAELIAGNYPDRPEYLALLKEHAGDDLSKGDAETALFFRRPGLEEQHTEPLSFADNLFPVLCLGQVRTGEHGRRSLALLSATHWGGHHHRDSLNLYYWKDNHELLTDLGYLWDHPRAGMTSRTFAHNTGMVDLAEQRTSGRGGRFHLFHTGERVKVMEASSHAYDKADIYRRSVVQVDHGENSYLLDLFRLQANGSRDLVYHGPNNEYTLDGIELQEGDIAGKSGNEIRFGLRFHVAQMPAEIQVDDVSITTADGTELAVNRSAAEVSEETGRPIGWNLYSGSGKAEWGVASPGRTDDTCAYMKVVESANGVNLALIQGDTGGYSGPNALLMPEGSDLTVSFWIRGEAPGCAISLVTWPNDPTSPADRDHRHLGSVPVTAEWTRHELQLGFRKSMDLENIRSTYSPESWRMSWAMADDVEFTALHCGQVGELAYIGDGWGQRDHRDTDVGVTIPYIIRRHRPAAGTSMFVTVYEAHRPGERLVNAAYPLALPDELRESVVAVEVETAHGTDIIVSQLDPVLIEVSTSAGRISTDAALCVLGRDADGRAYAAIAGGTMLKLNDADQAVERLVQHPEFDLQVAEAQD